MIMVGQIVAIGWNGAKRFGNENLAYSEARVEAVGTDWIVIRDEQGRAHAATFPASAELGTMLRSLGE